MIFIDVFTFIWDYIVPFVLVLTILVFVHEMGHFSVARFCRVRVDVFSIGFGPEIFGWTSRSGTRWKFSVIPLGGYVKMFGDRDASSAPDTEAVSSMTEDERMVAFHHKTLSQRSAIIAAGPIANFLFAIAIYAGLYWVLGQPSTIPELAKVNPESAAERAGLEVGDMIVEIDGRRIDRFEEVKLEVLAGHGTPMEVTVLRNGVRKTYTVTPDVIELEDRFGNKSHVGLLGVSSETVVFEPRTLTQATWEATRTTYNYTMMTLRVIGQLIMGLRSTSELAGPIGIAKLSGDMAQAGIVGVLLLMAILSINLGLINLFPIPVLDGGHLMFILFEAIRGQPLGERAQEYGFRFGLGLVLLLMIFVTWNDVMNIVSRLV